jgi:MFS family permease
VIVFGALFLLGGRLPDIIGQLRIFVIDFAIHTAASVLAGLVSKNVLIAARALQGIDVALIASSALSIALTSFYDLFLLKESTKKNQYR